MKYRAEIDGLRALAVLPVIFFHANFSLFSGGYIGVDVFFVISGYLITTIILNQKEKNQFKLSNFYERRARRILPALMFVVFVSIPFAWMWIPAQNFRDFAHSIVAVATFSSNFLFWKESGYFDTDSELKPLLHTWSLSVEEQYYILFPLIVMLLWKYGKKTLLITIAAIFLTSLCAAHWLSSTKQAATFFLLPTRSWEIFLGALCAFYLQNFSINHFRKYNQILSFTGLSFILFAIFFFDKTTPTPSFYTLIPTIGTGLIILFAHEGTLANKFLKLSPLVGIGLISYSTYLWHQPILAFARYSPAGNHFTNIALLLIILALLLGWLSWKYIETPFRNKKIVSTRNLVTLSIGGTVFFVSIGQFGYAKKGFISNKILPYEVEKPLVSNNFFVIGDSHAEHLLPGLTKITTGLVENKTLAGCIPLLNVDRYDSKSVKGKCAKKMTESLHDFSQSEKWDTIILSSMGPVYLDGTSFRNLSPRRTIGLKVELTNNLKETDRWKVYAIGLKNTFEFLSSLKNKNAVFVIDVPELGINYGCNKGKKEIQIFNLTLQDYVKEFDKENCKIPRSEYDIRNQRYKNLIKNVAKNYPKITVFDPTPLFCDSNWCYGYKNNYGYLYSDLDHLNKSGSNYFAKYLSEFLLKENKNKYYQIDTNW